jgi:hypothetical protein
VSQHHEVQKLCEVPVFIGRQQRPHSSQWSIHSIGENCMEIYGNVEPAHQYVGMVCSGGPGTFGYGVWSRHMPTALAIVQNDYGFGLASDGRDWDFQRETSRNDHTQKIFPFALSNSVLAYGFCGIVTFSGIKDSGEETSYAICQWRSRKLFVGWPRGKLFRISARRLLTDSFRSCGRRLGQ